MTGKNHTHVKDIITGQNSGPLASGQLAPITSLFDLTCMNTDEPTH